MASNVHRSVSSSTGTAVLTQAAGPGVVWNLTYLSISFAGPVVGPNTKLTIYDGSTSGDVLFSAFLPGPSGSVGIIHKIDIPEDAKGQKALQASPGNAMVIVVNGFGANQCIINARLTDGLP